MKIKKDLIERHRNLLELNDVKNIQLGISALFCEDDLEQLERALSNCNKALLKEKHESLLPCPGEGWSVSIDPASSVEERGEGYVEVEFMYGDNHPDSEYCHIPIKLYKNLIDERYSNLKSENYFKNGQVKSTGNYLNGKRQGLWTSFYENRNIKSNGYYHASSKVKIWEYFYENGQIKERKDYDEKIYLISQTYWYENGQIKGDWESWDEHKSFKLKWYFDTGEVSAESMKTSEDIYIDGEHKTYFKNGNLKTVIFTKNNKIIQYRYYNEDGTIEKISKN